MKIEELSSGILLIGRDADRDYDVFVFIKSFDRENNIVDFYTFIDVGYQIGIHHLLSDEKEQWDKNYKDFKIATEHEVHNLLVKITTVHTEAYIENEDFSELLKSISDLDPLLKNK